MPRPEHIGDDEPVRLADADAPMPLTQAAQAFFPFGGVTVSTLRTEARKGRLVIERIGGKDFVTRRAIEEMRARCRVEKARPASPSESKQTGAASGSSETDSGIDAQTALSMKLERLKKGLGNTSRKSVGPTRRNVVPLRSN